MKNKLSHKIMSNRDKVPQKNRKAALPRNMAIRHKEARMYSKPNSNPIPLRVLSSRYKTFKPRCRSSWICRRCKMKTLKIVKQPIYHQARLLTRNWNKTPSLSLQSSRNRFQYHQQSFPRKPIMSKSLYNLT